MPTAFVFRVQPKPHERFDRRDAQELAGNTEDVRIVMESAEFGGNFAVADRGADVAEFVRHNPHADASAANQDPSVCGAGRDYFCHCGGDVRIVQTALCFVDGKRRGRIARVLDMGVLGTSIFERPNLFKVEIDKI